MTFSTLRKTAAGLSLAGLLLLVAWAMAYQSARWSLENSSWITHTHEVLDQLHATLADAAQLRNAARVYLINGDEDSLRQYHAYLSSTESDLKRLRDSTYDNPSQQEHVAILTSQIDQLTVVLNHSVATRQPQRVPSLQQLSSAQGRDLATSIESTIRSMEAEEHNLLRERQVRLQHSSRSARIAFGVAVCLEFLLLILVFYMIRKELANREQSERALKESEERFRLLVSGVTDYAIYRLSPAGYVATWNEGAQRIKGYTQEEIVGRHFSCFFTPEDVACGKPGHELEVAIAQGHYAEEGWRVRKDGTRFWASVVITALRDHTGALRGFSKITRDITERKRTDELLLHSEEKHRKLFENNPHPTWAYDRETLKFLAVNAAAVEKYGYSRDEFLTITLKDIRPPEYVPALLARVGRVRDGRQNVSEVKHKLRDGTAIDVEVTSFPLNFEGRPAEVVVAVDVTQRRRDEEEKQRFIDALARTNKELELRTREAEHATKLKSKFLANMSHELRTPLNAIVGFSGLLADGTAGPLNEKQQRFITHIKNGSHHLLQLINDILDLSKIEAGQLEIHCEDFQIGDALPEVLSTIRPLAMAKNIHVQHRSETERAVFADRVRFKQILYNLLSNAIKFTPDGGRVAVDWLERDDFICVSVTDTGVGIRREDQELIFEEFRQVEAEGAHEGTGLGLAITRRIVEQHEGRLWVESQIGHGSRFSFTLPAAAHHPAERPHPRATPAVAGQTERDSSRREPLILIVDDEGPARELLVSYLEPEGYRTETAATAAEAIEKAKKLHPDSITLDVLMPNANGFEILLTLKGAPETADIPIIVVSIVDQQKVGFALGAADYLVKPVAKDTLLNTIRKYTRPQPASESVILVVDDDSVTLDLVDTMLRSAGYKTHTAASGKAALALLSSTMVDGMLLDLLMPEMDGFEVLRNVKQDPRLKDIPIFILSAKSLTESDLAFLRRQTQALFQKDGPWREELIATLTHTVETRRKEHQAGSA